MPHLTLFGFSVNIWNMEGICYKINAGPRAISILGLDELRKSYIPSILKNAYKTDNLKCFQLGSIDASQKDAFYTEYRELLDITEKVAKRYSVILNDFYNTYTIAYPSDYLQLVATAKKKRKAFCEHYPFIRANLGDGGEKRFLANVDGRVGTGVNHMVQMGQIATFVENNGDNIFSQQSARMSYDPSVECISVYSEKEDVFKNAAMLQHSINEAISKKDRVKYGRIIVNPIFEQVRFAEIKDKMTLTFYYSYPNGDTDAELAALLDVTKEVEAECGETRFANASSEKALALAQAIGANGYLIDVRRGEHSIIDVGGSDFRRKQMLK